MRVLSLTIAFLILALAGQNQDSPHGSDFEISCNVCHSTNSWELDKEIYSFEHNTTSLPLEGQHTLIGCKKCHSTLIFSDAKTDCFSCHTDIHYQTVGVDCGRCHTPTSWIVENITDIHRLGQFPLQGPHFAANCQDCHQSASLLRFEPLGSECVDCHMQDYQSALQPDHVLASFSTLCIDCHVMTAFTWVGSGFNHLFFPLTQGHVIEDCLACHVEGDYLNVLPDCFSCHETDFNATTNPNHPAASLSTDCSECHTTLEGWKPADFRIHDTQYFPVFSGSHKGEWNSCVDCHTNLANYAGFSCIDCHEHNRTEMDDEHSDEKDYQYNSIACLECHPTGSEDDD